jgi:hypothetical protein
MAIQHKSLPCTSKSTRIKPSVWRRIAVDANMMLRTLHHVIQAAFGWTDVHLHEYIVEERKENYLP